MLKQHLNNKSLDFMGSVRHLVFFILYLFIFIFWMYAAFFEKFEKNEKRVVSATKSWFYVWTVSP